MSDKQTCKRQTFCRLESRFSSHDDDDDDGDDDDDSNDDDGDYYD